MKVPKFDAKAAATRRWDERKAAVEENLLQAMRDRSAQCGTGQRLI
jgi:hypothetical protein